MHLEIFGGKCVSTIKKCIFISLEKCFCTVFFKFFELVKLCEQSWIRVLHESDCIWSVVNILPANALAFHEWKVAVPFRWATNLTTKIITLLEFFNFVSEVFRLQYEWSSDRWCIWSSFGGKCVSTIKKCVFISLEKCFCTVFFKFFEVIIDCTCALADQSRNTGVVYEHYCLCSGYCRTIVSRRIPSCILSRAGVRLCGTQTFQSPSVVGQRNQAKAPADDDFFSLLAVFPFLAHLWLAIAMAWRPSSSSSVVVVGG
jgi:hypothetical protein